MFLVIDENMRLCLCMLLTYLVTFSEKAPVVPVLTWSEVMNIPP